MSGWLLAVIVIGAIAIIESGRRAAGPSLLTLIGAFFVAMVLKGVVLRLLMLGGFVYGLYALIRYAPELAPAACVAGYLC